MSKSNEQCITFRKSITVEFLADRTSWGNSTFTAVTWSLTILLPRKILTWCWSTLGIAGFFFEVAIRHQNKVEPLSLLNVLCVTLERNVGIQHPGGPNGYNTKTLKCHFTDLFNTWTWYKAFGFALSLSFLSGWKEVTCISDVSLNSRGILHFISIIYYFLVASETNESSKVSSVWVVTK